MDKLNFTKKNTVNGMILSLESYAKNKHISLENNIPEDVNDFDDVFKDGGEARCEYFTDLAIDYGMQFGTDLEDYENENGVQAHIWKCINSAMKKLQKKWNEE